MRLPRIRSFVAVVAVLMVVVALVAPAAVAVGPSIERSPGSGPAGTTAALPIDSEMLHRPQPFASDDGAASGGESTAAGWLAVAIAIAGTVLAVGFVMITTTHRRHHPAHRAPHPHAA